MYWLRPDGNLDRIGGLAAGNTADFVIAPDGRSAVIEADPTGVYRLKPARR